MKQDLPSYSDTYAKVLNLATRYASGTSDHVIRLKHLLAAFLDTNGDVFFAFLG